MKSIRVLETPSNGDRVESGAIQFGDDWPGLFLRGDECIQLAISIESYLSSAQLSPTFSVDSQNRLICSPDTTMAMVSREYLQSLAKMIREDVLLRPKTAEKGSDHEES